MDLLDKINSLTDDQLQMVAERDDASGVLAAYRLAEIRGLPCPERSAVITGDGYVIIAQNGLIQRVETEGVTKIIRQEEGEYCVYSEDGSRSFGCYPTMADAEERLRQIHYFGDETEKAIREGSFVSWNSSGGRARGRIEHIMTEGVLGVPDSDFSIAAEPDDPAVLIRIWRETSEGWKETETLVGHKMSTLTSIDPLTKESFVPPEGVQEAGKRALGWIAEDHAGSGFTDVGRARAAQLARGDAVSEETIRRMSSYFSRHKNDSNATGWNNGEEGFPSPGRVAWDAWGGDAGRTWADMMVERFNREEKSRPVGKGTILRKADEKQFTLGPLYVPDFMDAHGEWTDSEELQNAVWGWVRSGDRRIFLQHDTDVVAGEWVEVMTMPQPWTVQMTDSNGVVVGEATYPKDTVFLGVVWNDEAWDMVKRGELRGYSIGGYSDRMMADLPLEADRDGVEIPVQEATKDISKTIADAIALAMSKNQPVVNVVMSDERKTRVRRIERDEHGNIARIIEEEEV